MNLVPLYKEMAASGTQFQGLSILAHKEQIGELIERHKAKSLFDFGCGRGDAYQYPHMLHRAWKVERPTLYDPAFEQHDQMPAEGVKFDGVICSDVLEHVPMADLQFVVDELFIRANKFVWASVCCRPAKKTFPDGRNLHVTIETFRWWQRFFQESSTGDVAWTLVETK